MNEKSKINYEKMARPIRFKTLFFKISKGNEFIINAIKNIDTQKTHNEKRKKYRLEQSQEENDFIIGDLQQIHNANAVKITVDKETIVNSENFNENELLGYNNVFCYSDKHYILALQHNNNGVGAQSFEDMLNNHITEALSGDGIRFSIIEQKDKFNDVENFNSIEFKISKYQNIDDDSFMEFNELKNKIKFDTCKVILKSETFLDFNWVKKAIPSLQSNKNIQLEDLKTDCILSNGENAELNFLSNKAQKIEDITTDTELDYFERKKIIIQRITDFIKDYE